jgi:hypothetical protein
MLTAKPTSIFSWCFVVCRDGVEIAEIDTAWLYEGGTLHCDGDTYRLGKAGVFSGEFFLEKAGVRMATARKTTLIRRFAIEYGGETFTFRAESPLTRSFVLESAGGIMGRIAPDHPFTRRSSIRMLDELPVAVQLWLFWLAVLMWRRAAASA